MLESPYLRLESLSVVVTAEFHNPSILNPDFLVSRRIVPSHWKVSEALTTSAVSVVKYDNGVEWAVDQSRLSVSEKAGPTLEASSRVHELATEYLTKLPHVPYRDLGLNCQVSMKEFDPRSWLLKRFAPSWLEGERIVQGLSPKLVLDANDAVCHCNLAEALQDGHGYVVADCNVHHQGLQGVEGLCDAILRWENRQRWIMEVLNRLMVREVMA